MDRRIKTLIVDDSNVVRAMLVNCLNSDPGIEVVGAVRNGREALKFLEIHRPDVIVMDIDMPEMDGFETTRHIMETQPVPIVICSGSTDPYETMTTFRAMEAGAVACIEKPQGIEHGNYERMLANLVQTVRLMSEVKVVRRWARSRRSVAGSEPTKANGRHPSKVEIIGIGASTGGPPVLQTILNGLPKDFSLPILIVQHIAAGFLPGLIEWLNQTTGVKVHAAAYGMQPLAGHAYLAPDDFHLTVRPDRMLALTKEAPEQGLRPAVGRLFHSLSDVYRARAASVLLSGMGKDGAAEMKLMNDRGSVTIAQDKESSVVHGMPGEAIRLNGVTHVLAADLIAPALVSLASASQPKVSRGPDYEL